MKPVEINQRIQFHTDEASRLLQSNPLIREYLYHAQKVGELQAALNPKKPASKAKK